MQNLHPDIDETHAGKIIYKQQTEYKMTFNGEKERGFMMQKMGKRIISVIALCLILGLQSAGTAQAAINYEACPFCGTRVERYTSTVKVASVFMQECIGAGHGKCNIYHVFYDDYDFVHCQIIGCLYRETAHNNGWDTYEHIPE